VSPGRDHDRRKCVEVDEIERLARLWPRHARWHERGEDPSLTVGQREYAKRRARSLRRTTVERTDLCETSSVDLVCQCGPRSVAVGCGQHYVCCRCRRKRWTKVSRRIRLGFERVELQPDELVVLSTHTLAHSGDVEADWTELMRGWRRYYKALKKRGWAPRVYVGVVEVTPGRDGLGHVHLHVAYVQTGFVAWGPSKRFSGPRERRGPMPTDLHTLWRQSCPTSSHLNLALAYGGKYGAGKYVAKYMSKGVDTRDFTPQLRAGVLAASYQRRQIVSSVGFFGEDPPCACPTCKAEFANLNHLAAALGILPRWVPGFLRGERTYGAIDEFDYVWKIDFTGGTRDGPPPKQERTVYQAQA
jgi:hypothetical protein